MSDRAVIQPKSSITVKQANDLIKEVNIPLNITFKVFDKTEMSAIVMEPEPGGELLDKVVKVYENETIMVEETANLFVKTGKSSVDNISSLNKENDETSLS